METLPTVVKWIENLRQSIKKEKNGEKLVTKVDFVVEWAMMALRMYELMPGSIVQGVTVDKITIKEDTRDPKKVTMTVAGHRGKENVVTFHSGWPGADLFFRFLSRGEAGTLAWKLDTPWKAETVEDDEQGLPALPGP